MNTTPTRRPAALLALAAAAALVLAGCAPTADAEPAAVAPTTAAENVTIADAWVKAADEGMTAAFGELTNTGDTEVSVLASTSAAATMTELHETVDDGSGSMSMQEKEGGFVLPAGGTLVLEPGGNHLMLMGLTAPLVAGDEIEITLSFSDGSEFTFAAPAKDFSGANETYDLLTAADTTGIFQLESSGMRDLLRQMKPSKFEDIVALIALFRPGPLNSGMTQSFVKRHNHQEPVTYPHMNLEPILARTLGVPIFQEQVMAMAVAVTTAMAMATSGMRRRRTSSRRLRSSSYRFQSASPRMSFPFLRTSPSRSLRTRWALRTERSRRPNARSTNGPTPRSERCTGVT